MKKIQATDLYLDGDKIKNEAGDVVGSITRHGKQQVRAHNLYGVQSQSCGSISKAVISIEETLAPAPVEEKPKRTRKAAAPVVESKDLTDETGKQKDPATLVREIAGIEAPADTTVVYVSGLVMAYLGTAENTDDLIKAITGGKKSSNKGGGVDANLTQEQIADLKPHVEEMLKVATGGSKTSARRLLGYVNDALGVTAVA